MMKKSFTMIFALLSIFNQAKGQKECSKYSITNCKNFYECYQIYHYPFVLFETELDTAILNSLASETICNSLSLSREERAVYFSNSIADTTLGSEAKMCLMLVTAGADFSSYAYLRNEIDSTLFIEFNKGGNRLLVHKLGPLDEVAATQNFKFVGSEYRNLFLYACYKYMIVKRYNYEDYKKKSEELDKSIRVTMLHK